MSLSCSRLPCPALLSAPPGSWADRLGQRVGDAPQHTEPFRSEWRQFDMRPVLSRWRDGADGPGAAVIGRRVLAGGAATVARFRVKANGFAGIRPTSSVILSPQAKDLGPALLLQGPTAQPVPSPPRTRPAPRLGNEILRQAQDDTRGWAVEKEQAEREAHSDLWQPGAFRRPWRTSRCAAGSSGGMFAARASGVRTRGNWQRLARYRRRLNWSMATARSRTTPRTVSW